MSEKKSDAVNHPAHYFGIPARCDNCGTVIECISVIRHQNFNLGNVIKYIWRAGHKGDTIEDLKKARWYLDDEIKRLESQKRVEEAVEALMQYKG